MGANFKIYGSSVCVFHYKRTEGSQSSEYDLGDEVSTQTNRRSLGGILQETLIMNRKGLLAA